MGHREHVGADAQVLRVGTESAGSAQGRGLAMPLTGRTSVLGRAAEQKQRLWQDLNGKVTNSNRP